MPGAECSDADGPGLLLFADGGVRQNSQHAVRHRRDRDVRPAWSARGGDGVGARARRQSLSHRHAGMHLWHPASSACRRCALWFYAIGGHRHGNRDVAQLHVADLDGDVPDRLGAAGRRAGGCGWWRPVLAGFVGVAAILRPSIDRDQSGSASWGCSPACSALAYLQITALGHRKQQPETQVVFFSPAPARSRAGADAAAGTAPAATMTCGMLHGYGGGRVRHRRPTGDDPPSRSAGRAGQCQPAVSEHLLLRPGACCCSTIRCIAGAAGHGDGDQCGHRRDPSAPRRGRAISECVRHAAARSRSDLPPTP